MAIFKALVNVIIGRRYETPELFAKGKERIPLRFPI